MTVEFLATPGTPSASAVHTITDAMITEDSSMATATTDVRGSASATATP